MRSATQMALKKTSAIPQMKMTLSDETCKYTRRIDFSKRMLDQKVLYQLEGSTLKTISGCIAYDGAVEKIYKRRSGINQ